MVELQGTPPPLSCAPDFAAKKGGFMIGLLSDCFAKELTLVIYYLN